MHRHLAPISAITAFMLALTGCTADGAAAPEPLPAPPEMSPNCGAGLLGGYIGHQASSDVIEALRDWRAEHKVRVIRPGQAVTMDYLPDRLNIEVDDTNTIRKFTCG